MQLLKDYIQSLRDEFAMLNATDTTTARDHDSLTSLPINYKTEEIQMMAPSGSGSAEKVAPPDGRGGWGPPISPQATTPAASFKTLMDDVHAALRKIDNLPGGYNDPPLASALEVYNCPSTKRTRARDDPVIAALLKALQDEHDRAVAKHENNHALLGETFNTSEPKAVVDSKKKPHSDTKTAPVPTTIDNDNKKTLSSDNVSTPAALLPLKPPCDSMCLLEQSAGGTSKTERKTKVVEDSTASTPPKKKKTPHSDTKTAPVPTTIDKDHKKTPPSDNVSTPAAQLPLKPPCNSMCPLEQSAGGPSKTEWKTDVVDDSAVSKPREKTRTPHSGNWETTAGMRFFCQWVDDCPPREDALCDHLIRHLGGNHDDCAFDDLYDADF